jgi:hypothetical protein
LIGWQTDGGMLGADGGEGGEGTQTAVSVVLHSSQPDAIHLPPFAAEHAVFVIAGSQPPRLWM